jgi:hypothetical protein
MSFEEEGKAYTSYKVSKCEGNNALDHQRKPNLAADI